MTNHAGRMGGRYRPGARSRLLLLIATFIAASVAAAGCSSTPDASRPETSAARNDGSPTAGDVDTSNDVSSNTADSGPSNLVLRPVLEILAPSAPSDADVLSDRSGQRFRLGPSTSVNPAVVGGQVVLDPSNGWQIQIAFAPGGAGIDIFNDQARACHAMDVTCPTGQLALVVGGDEVLSAPSIEPGIAEFEPFEADQISISGAFTEVEARSLLQQIRAN